MHYFLFLVHIPSVETEDESKLKRQGAIRRKEKLIEDVEEPYPSENLPFGVFSGENPHFCAENPQNESMEVNFNADNVGVIEPLKKEINIDDFMDISDVDLNLSPEKKEISGLEIISNQSISIPPRRVNSNVKLSLSNGKNSINTSTETYVIDNVADMEVNLSLSPEKKEINAGEFSPNNNNMSNLN